MTSNQKNEDELKIEYKDGKPIVKKDSDADELKKELHKNCEIKSQADAAKSALYADLPKAKQKLDRSITARALNTLVESYEQKRNKFNKID